MGQDLQEQIKRWTTPSPETKRAKKEEAEFRRKRLQEISVIDLRDQTISHVLNTFGHGETAFERCHASGGPTAQTLKNWQNDKVRRPQMPTLRAALWSCGKDLGIVDRKP